MKGILQRFSLRTQLLFIFLLLLIITISSLTLIYSRSEKILLEKVSEDIGNITRAINISVEELTYKGDSTERLKVYVEALKKKGIQEISIISDNSEVIGSSDPSKIGTKGKIGKKKVTRKDLMIMAQLGEKDIKEGQQLYNVIMPVNIKGENIGYILISLVLDDYKLFHRRNFLKRIWSSIFAIGIVTVISMIIAKRYTEPIKKVAHASRRIAEGDLMDIEDRGRHDEIGMLIRSFNEMVQKLRERKELEDRLKRSEQLSIIGQLSSGIAHEIRNPLNFLSLSIGHIRERIEEEDIKDKDDLLTLLESLRKEIYRVNDLIQNFLLLGKPIKLEKEWIAPDALIEEALCILKGKIGHGIEIKISYKDNNHPLYCDREFMRICLFNLLLNAFEAIEGNKGEVNVEFGREDAESYISVADTGVGIGDEDKGRIFEPYFSTKKHGCGLGLTITRRLVGEHGGRITIESGKGEGTTVSIRVPCHEG